MEKSGTAVQSLISKLFNYSLNILLGKYHCLPQSNIDFKIMVKKAVKRKLTFSYIISIAMIIALKP